MINIKVTSRMKHEDYVALYTASPYILPRKHFLGIGISVLLSIVLVLPMPSTWRAFTQDSSALTADSAAYLATDQSAQERAIEQDQSTKLQENYEDYDIPSHYFKDEQHPTAETGAIDDEQALASSDDLHEAETGADASEDDAIAAIDTDTSDAAASTEAPAELTPEEQQIRDNIIAGESKPDDVRSEEVDASTAAQLANNEEATTEASASSTDTSTETAETTETGDMLAQTQTPATESSADTDSSAATAETAAAEPQEEISEVRPEGTWYRQTVKSGDSLSEIFSYLNLPYATLNRITKVAATKDLRLKVGEPIYFLIDKENVVKEMVKGTGHDQQVRFTRMTASDDFRVVYEDLNAHMDQKALASVGDATSMPLAVAAQKEREAREAKLLAERKAKEERDRANNVNPNRPRLVVNSLASGETFAKAGHRAGLTPSEIKTITQIFKSKFNVNKMRTGDKFRVLFTGIGTSALISAVQLQTSQGKFESFMNPEDRNYYGENEFTPTAGIFRRFPLSGEIKINSQFNPHRRHPVTRRISPHNGVDFKAKIGTPVYAPADGVVSFSGYQHAAGYYIIIRHANNYSTVYMHLSKSEVKRDQKVIVGQLIARTGNTGRTTGPHLHYEIRINDRPVNPLKVELPSSNHPNLAREQREAFANNVKILRNDLQNDRLAIARSK